MTTVTMTRGTVKMTQTYTTIEKAEQAAKELRDGGYWTSVEVK